MKEDNISQLGDYDLPFCEQQNMHGSCCISLFKFKSVDQFIPPKLLQILDIYSVVALQVVVIEPTRTLHNCRRCNFHSSITKEMIVSDSKAVVFCNTM